MKLTMKRCRPSITSTILLCRQNTPSIHAVVSITTTAMNSTPKEQYKLTVEYNGFRFNGFQRQMDQSKSLKKKSQQKQQHHKQGPPKRPHVDNATGRKKGVPFTIQECLESAILNYIQFTQKEQHSSNKQEVKHKKAKLLSPSSSEPPKNELESSSESASQAFSLADMEFNFAGRTDKGVHARGQVVTCYFPQQETSTATKTSTRPCSFLDHMMQGINSRLPLDISVSRIEGPLVQPLDPRNDAIQKQYSYTLRYHRWRQQPKDSNDQHASSLSRPGGVHTMRRGLQDSPVLWLCPWELQDKHISTICQALSGTHDFTLFTHKAARDLQDKHDLNVDLSFSILETTSTLDECGEIVTARFLARAKGFRRAMVRNLVGFCVQLMKERVVGPPAQEDMNTSDENRLLWDRWVAPHLDSIESAPASGLCMDYVLYPGEDTPKDDETQVNAIN